MYFVVFGVGFFQLADWLHAQASPPVPTARVADVLRPAPPGQVKLDGFLGDKIDTCIRHRIMAQSISDLIEPFQKRPEAYMWRCEFWGKWFTSAAAASQYTHDAQLRTIIDKAVADLLATQTANGYIGTYKDDAHLQHWDIWGRKYVLLGLLAYYDITGDSNVLDAAMRHADFLLTEVGPGKANIVEKGHWTGMAASSVLEPMVLLYRRTGQQRYLDFSNYIIEQWASDAGPQLIRKALADVPMYLMFPGHLDVSKPPVYPEGYFEYGQSKAYEMMSCFEGLTELYRVTARESYRQALLKVFDNIRKNELTITGSGSDMERWFGGHFRQAQPVREWMETCVTVTWMKLCYQLLRLTGDPKFADEIEISSYNALAGAMKQDGTWWSHYNPLNGIRGPAPKQCEMNQNCCVANGPRGMMLLPTVAVMSDATGPVVNLYSRGRAKLPLTDDNSVLLTLDTDYPRSDTITLLVQPEKPARFTISLRIPGWCKNSSLKINGKDFSVKTAPGTYARIDRSWQDNDKIELHLEMTGTVLAAPNSKYYLAVMRGPIVLALDKRLCSGFLDQTLLWKKDDTDAIELTKSDLPDQQNIWMAFTAPALNPQTGKTIQLPLCDYASAGNTWSEDSHFRLWLPQPFNVGKSLEKETN